MQRKTHANTFIDGHSGVPRKGEGGLCLHIDAFDNTPTHPTRLWWGERRHKSPADLAERYRSFATLLLNARRLLTLVNRLSEPRKFKKFCSIARLVDAHGCIYTGVCFNGIHMVDIHAWVSAGIFDKTGFPRTTESGFTNRSPRFFVCLYVK